MSCTACRDEPDRTVEVYAQPVRPLDRSVGLKDVVSAVLAESAVRSEKNLFVVSN